MAVCERKAITDKYKTGHIEWSSPENVRLILNKNCSSSFKFCEFECNLRSSIASDSHGKYTTFYLTDTKFPEWFSCAYTMSLIDSDGNECLTTKGNLPGKSGNILMTVYDKYIQDRLPSSGYFSLRISWDVDDECSGFKQEKDISDWSAPVEKPMYLRLKFYNTSTENDWSSDWSAPVEKPMYLPLKDYNTSTENDISDWSASVEKPVHLELKDYNTSTEIKVFDRSVQTEEPNCLPSKINYTSTDEEDITLLKVLSSDLGHLYESEANSDCVLKVGETKFPVHRQMLAARSTVFEAMFRHDTTESRSGTVDIPDADANAMSDVLFYVYTGKIRSMTSESAVPMYVVADKYALMELRDKCMGFLLHNLTTDNICDAAVLAHTHGETELENKVVLFIEERLKELMESENWKKFLKDKSILASKLLCSALMAKQERMEKTSS